MKKVEGKVGADKDFLWLFRGFEKAAFCLSSDYHIMDLTKAAETLFGVTRKTVLQQPIKSFFSSLSLAISFVQKSNKLAISVVVEDGAKDFNQANKICRLGWKVKSNLSFDNPEGCFIIYAEEQADVEYLAEEYKLITGQDKIVGESVKDYAEGIKSYLEGIINNMPGYIYWTDKNSVCLGCNDNDARLFGLKSRKELVGLSFDEIKKRMPWLADSIDLWWKDSLEVVNTGKPKLNIEDKPFITPDGKEVFLLTSRVPLFDKDKNVIGILGISIDIADRKLAERQLQLTRERAEKELLGKVNEEITGQVYSEGKSSVAYVKDVQNYLENIIACLPGNVYWLDKNLTILGCNNNAAKFMGLKSRKDIVGLTYKDFQKKLPEMSRYISKWEDANLEVIKSGKAKVNLEEEPIILPNGKESHYIANRIPLFDDKNNVIGVVVSALDISDRKEVEKLQAEQAVVEKTSKFMRMLAGSIAHELRTPLAIIGISADLLAISPAFVGASSVEKDAIDGRLKSIKHAIKIASFTIDNMLVVLKTLTAKVHIKDNFKRLSIASDVEKILATYPFLEQERSLVSVKLGRIKDFVYQGDDTLTQYMLYNLVRNSIHAIRETERGEIEISFDEDDDYSILRFTDTAMGIPEEVLIDIFEPFSSRKQLGSGLGLAFCKEVMQVYGGDISCKSEINKYTEFTLKFPKSLSKNSA